MSACLTFVAMVGLTLGTAVSAAAQESVTITLPTTITFSVTDVTSATPADLDPVTVQFSGAAATEVAGASSLKIL